MNIEGPAHNLADRIAFVVGVPVLSGVVCLFARSLFGTSSTGVPQVIVIGFTILIVCSLVAFAVFCLRARIQIDADGISLSQFGRRKTVKWDDLEKYDYPISMGRGGFTAYGAFTRKDGTKELFPCGGRRIASAMAAILINKDIWEKMANQTADRMPRSAPREFGRQQ